MKSKYKEKKNPNVQKAGNASFGSLRAGGGGHGAHLCCTDHTFYPSCESYLDLHWSKAENKCSNKKHLNNDFF